MRSITITYFAVKNCWNDYKLHKPSGDAHQEAFEEGLCIGSGDEGLFDCICGTGAGQQCVGDAGGFIDFKFVAADDCDGDTRAGLAKDERGGGA